LQVAESVPLATKIASYAPKISFTKTNNVKAVVESV
jgi:hypothetical protein